MCGIGGIVSLGSRPVDPGLIKPMCDIQAHRGPDDAGYAFFRTGATHTGSGGYWCGFTDPAFAHLNEHLPVLGGNYYSDQMSDCNYQLAFGHRRLAIQDLTHYGHQPMSNSDRRYWIVFNGEIYNFPQLRQELEVLGHTFHTRCDTEVILKGWEQWGHDVLPRLNGMFAFALYDRLNNYLLLARDRFGVKPLYYSLTPDFFVFASEPKGILASSLVSPQFNTTSLVEYFTFQNNFGSDTLFEGVKILAPGEIIEVRPGTGRPLNFQSFHQGFPGINSAVRSPESLSEEVSHAFAAAVRRQLISDVDVGAYLSGGMDSGSIVAVAGRSIPRLLTFTGGFDLTNVDGIEQGFDERKIAEKLSYLLQTEHYDVVLHAGDMPAAMERITWYMDDPRVGMCHQNWYVAKLASRFVKVCLAGAGGDELFAGYPWRYRNVIGGHSTQENEQRYFDYWCRLMPLPQMSEFFNCDKINVTESLDKVRRNFAAILRQAPVNPDIDESENQVQKALYFEFKTFMHGYLVTEDRISMAHSLESRVPFLDNDLADLAWSIPPSKKLDINSLVCASGQGHIASIDGKRILRQAMEKYLPKEFTQMPKQGFSPPDENWYRGQSMDYIKSILLDKKALERPWFNQKFVQNKLQEHFSGSQNHRLLIWSLLSIEWLQRHYIDGIRV